MAPLDSHRFFQNRKCRYFPCHSEINEDTFNCLFCYCPLYMLGKHCGGSFYYNEKGNKVCTHCTFPHESENYEKLLARYPQIREAIKIMDEKSL